MVHINARSLLANFVEVKLLITEKDIDVLCVSETWLLPHIPDSHCHIPGYYIFRCDKGHGGGTCVYVKDILSTKIISSDRVKPNGIEDIWVSVQHRKLPSLIIGSVYRHPKAPQESFEYIRETLKYMCLKNKGVYMFGDINDDLLSRNNKLEAIIRLNNLHQMIDKPTRVTPHSSTLLDILVTNRPDTIIHKEVIPCNIADHDLITAKINIVKPKRSPVMKTFRHLGTYSKDALCDTLLSATPALSVILSTDDVDYQTHTLTSVLSTCLDHCAPIVTTVIKKPLAPWINDDIRSAMKIRNTLQTCLKLDRHNLVLQEQYKHERNKVKALLRESEQTYYREKISDCRGNSAATWKIIKQITPPDTKTNHNFENESDMAAKFNELFVNVGENTFQTTQNYLSVTDQTYDDPLSNVNTEHLFRPQPVDINTVILTIKHLKSTKSAGSDGIALRFIQDSLPVTISYITTIINTSIVTGKFPTIWKQAAVIPIFKNGDKNDVKNYRPISLLPILSKILEKIVAKQLSTFLETNRHFSNTQYGFRQKFSTETALITLTNKLYRNIEEKKISLITLCDLSKAFDSVNHEILCRKLTKVNVDSFWFKDYLDNRSQYVRINKSLSTTAPIKYGVPQGSILGPILFNIFVNDLSEEIHGCEVIQYADDTQFVHTGTVDALPHLLTAAQNTLSAARTYFNKNGLLINENKTQCIFVGSRQLIKTIPENTTITFDNTTITPCKHIKNLGIHIDSHLTFDTHINETHRKVMGILLYLNRVKHKFVATTLKTVIESLALSIVNYCLPVYGTTKDTHMKRIQKLQNFAAKICVGGARRRDHATPYIKQLEWLKIEEKVVFDVAIMVYKIKNKIYPDWFIHLPTNMEITHNAHTTRQQNNLHVPYTKTDYGARSLLVLGPRIWNTLPLQITNANSLHAFTRKLKVHLCLG